MTGMGHRATQSMPRLILIADRPTCGEEVILRVLEEIAPHARPNSLMVIDRDPSPCTRDAAIRRLLNNMDAWLVVNGRPDLAMLSGADGVQLPENGLDTLTVRRHFPDLRVGRSCHGRTGLCRAQNEGADWALLSPIAAPSSKTITAPLLGLTGFGDMIKDLSIPVFGLGGMTPEITHGVMETGATGVATLGGVFLDPEPVNAFVQYLDEVSRFDIPG
jgi:thiamine-phosphate diphosphorylase